MPEPQRDGADFIECEFHAIRKALYLSGDGMVYAQPLYVSHVSIGGNFHNVFIVVTQHDTISAFDADSAGAALWSKSFINPAQASRRSPPQI